MECPVCMEVPTGRVFSCETCEGVVCQACLPRLAACPQCREDFVLNPPRRNRWAERAIARQ